MALNTAGIDTHQDTLTIGIVDSNGIEGCVEVVANTASGFAEAAELLTTHSVETVGIECSGSWGANCAVALHAFGYDVREVPPTRGAWQRRSRRLAKTDAIDAVCIARAMLAEPDLGPAQALEIYSPVLAEVQAVLDHRKALVETRKLMLSYAQSQLWKLPAELRDQVPTTGPTDKRLRALANIDTTVATTRAGSYQLSWLLALIDQDRAALADIRRLERVLDDLLDEHGTTLREINGIGPVNAATIACHVGDPTRFASEAKFARWCGTAAVALSSGEGHQAPIRHRLDFKGNRTINSVLYIASVTQQRSLPEASIYIDRKRAEGKTKREARRAHKRHLANKVIRTLWKDQKQKLQETS